MSRGPSKPVVLVVCVALVDPDGRVNLESMRKDLQFFREIGEFTDAKFKVEDIVDMSFAEAARRLHVATELQH